MKPTQDSNILITGGPGLVGMQVLKTLVDKGYQNIRATFHTKSHQENLPHFGGKVDWIPLDILDVFYLDEVVQSIDYVIHAAAKISMMPADRDQMMRTNVEGTANVVNLAMEHQVKKLIHISSVAALGRTGKPGKIDEKSKWVRNKYVNNYALSKHLAELEVWRGYHEGLPVLILNPSHILGPGNWNKGSGKIIKQVYDGLSYYPPGTAGYVDVRDVADMIVLALESDLSGERFICHAENLSYKDLFEKIAGALDVKPPSKELPGFLAGIAWRWFRLKSRIDGSQPIITRENIRNTFANFEYDNSKSRDTFDFSYRNFDETIRYTCRAFTESIKSGTDFASM